MALNPTSTYPARRESSSPNPGQLTASEQHPLEIAVIYTGAKSTTRALRAATALTRGLQARVRILAPLVVPYEYSLDQPHTQPGALAGIVEEMAADLDVDVRIDIVLCRDVEPAIVASLALRSVVVFGVRFSWWPGRTQRMARRLRAMGHQVLFASAE